MPSPFPGMDPFIEEQKWKGFHTQFVTALGQALIPQVRPRYVVDVEEYVYLAAEPDEPARPIGPDVSIADSGSGWRESADSAQTAVAVHPVVRTVPEPKHHRQHYLAIRNRQSLEVVTVIELLSPWNKDPVRGQEEYLLKRENVFAVHANLVEFDLLRGGVRLPTVEPLPEGDYFALVCRKERYPELDVYAWSLRSPLPPVPIPLAKGDPDARLDLQSIFTQTYDRAGYDYALDYHSDVVPPLVEGDAGWVRGVLKSRGGTHG